MYNVLEQLTVQHFKALAGNTCNSLESISLTHTELNACSANAITNRSVLLNTPTSNSSFGLRAKNIYEQTEKQEIYRVTRSVTSYNNFSNRSSGFPKRDFTNVLEIPNPSVRVRPNPHWSKRSGISLLTLGFKCQCFWQFTFLDNGDCSGCHQNRIKM